MTDPEIYGSDAYAPAQIAQRVETAGVSKARLGLPQLVVVLLQIGAFVTKVVAVVWFLMLIRWTLPRFRYDQAMRLGWLGLLPLAVLNIVLTAAVLLF